MIGLRPENQRRDRLYGPVTNTVSTNIAAGFEIYVDEFIYDRPKIGHTNIKKNIIECLYLLFDQSLTIPIARSSNK